jgi:hypothetical protein
MSARDSALSGKSISIVRTDLMADVSRKLIQALNEELTGAYPEPGATHFGLVPEEVSGPAWGFSRRLRGWHSDRLRRGATAGCGDG